MKKITLIILMSIVSQLGFAQLTSLQEGFEGATFPPTDWNIYDNGVGLVNSWTRVNAPADYVHSGTWAAFMNRENIGQGNTAEDWLVTPQITVPNNGQLSFFTRTTLAGNQGTIYQIRVSTNSDPSNLAAYTVLEQWNENQLTEVFNVYEEKIVSLQTLVGQDVYIAFVMTFTQPTTALGGDRWLVDDVAVVEQCLDPEDLFVTGIGLDSVTLGWDDIAGATTWEVEVVQLPNAPTGSGVLTTNNPVSTNDLGLTLLEGTDYAFYVRAVCSESNSLWIGPFEFTTASLGETCEAPIEIASFPYTTTDNTSNYGDNYGGSPGSTGCGTGSAYLNGDDVFYSFTAQTDSEITITMTPSGTWSGLFVYSSCANVGVSCIAGVANSSSNPRVIVLPITAGQTYYIAISTWATTAALQSVGYTLEIIENTCTNFTSSFAVVSDCDNGEQFFATATVTNMGTATSIVANTSLGDTPQTINAPGTIQFGPYPNGTELTINLQNATDPNCFANSNTLTQQFCPFTNNLCADAIPITCGTTQTQTTVGATTAGAPGGTCGTTGGSGGLWYTFEGTGDVVTFSLCGSMFNTKLQVYTGSCGTFTCVAGNDDFCGQQSEVQIISTLGVTYYIYVFGSGAAQGVFTLNTLCEPAPTPPANNECSAATEVTVNTDGTCDQTVTGSLYGATASSQPNPCGGFANDDVWFYFTATQDIHTIRLLNLVGSTTAVTYGIFNAGPANGNPPDCSSLTLVGCSTATYNYVTGLTPGNNYVIRLYSTANTILQTTTFDLCVSVPPPPPANDECADAIEVPVNPDNLCGTTVSATLTSATASSQPTTCGGIPNDDVWFQFVATGTSHTIDLVNIQGTTTNLYHVIYQGNDCGSLTQVQCSDPNNSILNNLTPGATYYVRVYTNLNTIGGLIDFEMCVGTIPPPIYASTTDYTVPELVEDVLLNSTCALITNIQWSTGTNFGSTNGIGYFNKNGSTLPFDDGIILCTGNAANAPGPNTTILSDGSTTWPGDPDLQAILATQGVTGQTRNATTLQFDFVPLADQISFNFIFASEEYGTFQCSFSDVFAFLLTDLTSGVTTNLAVVPGTNTPISVTTIRNQLYNTSCASVNPEYFGQFYQLPNGLNPIGAPTNYNGLTVPLTASSPVIPGNTYRIKMAIADYSDTAYDSAVFLQGDSFNLGNVDLGADYLVVEGNAICPNSDVLLDSGLDPNVWDIIWMLDDEVIPGEEDPIYLVTTPGTYTIVAQIPNSDCITTDTIIVEYFDGILPGQPNNLVICSADNTGVFDLTVNEGTILAPLGANYMLSYFVSESDLEAGVNAIADPENYTNTSNPQTIYVKVEPLSQECYEMVTFDLILEDLTPDFTLTPDTTICEGTSTLITVTPINYIDSDVTYTWLLNNNPLPNNTSTIVAEEEGEYEVIVDFGGCATSQTMILTVEEAPELDPIDDVIVCFEYELPPLSEGDYFTESGGNGTLLPAGTIINFSQTIYVYATVGDCSDEVSFEVILAGVIAASLDDVTACGEYQLPALPANNNYYTESGAQGSMLNAGDIITSSQTLYIYAVSDLDPSCVSESSFTITIVDDIEVDELNDVSVCEPYTLPSLGVGNYYTEPDGQGTMLTAGTEITVSQTLYIFAQVGDCSDESSFNITIGAPEVDFMEDVEICDTYILPGLIHGTYYTGPNGTGLMLTGGDRITESQTLYIYSVDGNCTAESSFYVEVLSCIIPKGISPNGDGINDSLDLTNFDVRKLSIFNRYGIKVFSMNNYTNEWYGQSDGGKELPDGTYYYVIERNNDTIHTGWIYINRER